VNRVWAYESSPGEHVLQRLLLVLIFCGLLFGALGGWLYFSVNEQATRAQMTSARDHYGKVLADLERRWGVEAFNFKRRLESQSFLERAPLQQERLNAYLAAQGGSIEFPMLRIEDLKGGTVAAYDLLGRQMPRVTFLSGQETAWAIEPVDGRLFLVFRQLIWLGKENGYLFLYKPMDHALLTEHSYPFTRISLWWMGQPVASSDGDDGLADAASSLAQSCVDVSIDLAGRDWRPVARAAYRTNFTAADSGPSAIGSAIAALVCIGDWHLDHSRQLAAESAMRTRLPFGSQCKGRLQRRPG
jgi:hypothetical protein